MTFLLVMILKATIGQISKLHLQISTTQKWWYATMIFMSIVPNSIKGKLR